MNQTAGQFITGVFGLVAIGLAIILLLYWLAFPFLVMRYLKEILRELRNRNARGA